MALFSPRQLAKTITTAGTRVQLSTTQLLAVNVVIQSRSTNTGNIYVGTVAVSSTAKMATLPPGASLSIELPIVAGQAAEVDLSELYVDAATNLDVVDIAYYVRA